ncbi:MAG: hypothetical protein PHX53_00070 [Syntrophales bacterium]|nr:hypothetical protein [Syntrophales bacterium]
MDNAQMKRLCLSLMEADTETEVINILGEAGYWLDTSVWRFYGDLGNNYSTIGNQQARPDAALVEKLVNSVDARLMNECLVRGIDPEGPLAPKSIQEAVAIFFEDEKSKSSRAGLIKEWPKNKRREIARGITLTATGFTAGEGNPCFTISDFGEGQTPEMMPNTLLSLVRENKLRIPFVQGKFNMGGTGALKFCGKHGLQLIVSRRNPNILKDKIDHPSDLQWSFTIVRREDPEGGRRSSVFTYLAPLGAETTPSEGKVLHFSANSMPIFPSIYSKKPEPYGRLAEWGTLIKLYEYAIGTGFKGQIPQTGSVKDAVDLLLPQVALPIRLHECRKQFWDRLGAERSLETTITGLSVRLDDDKIRNLEENFPTSSPIAVNGEQMTANIYAFKSKTAKRYRKNEGIIFTVNGQTHAHLPTGFFKRKNVKHDYIADSILVMVDCSNVTGRTREDLFMNSRDRLSAGELRSKLEAALEEVLKDHPGLRELRERRRREATKSQSLEDKPFEDILKSMIERYPSLASLFKSGKQASNPFKPIRVENGLKFEGKRYPTYFKFKGIDYGKIFYRECHINSRCRITFETDASNDYFSRDIDPGERSLCIVKGESRFPLDNFVMNLWNGLAHLSVKLSDDCKIGDELCFMVAVTDPTQIEAFENTFVAKIKPPFEPQPAVKKVRRKHRKEAVGKKEGSERESSGGIALPIPILVHENEWEAREFTKTTALRILKSPGDSDGNGNGENGIDTYDYFINMDNVYLKKELKLAGDNLEIVRKRFIYGLILIGLALLQQELQKSKKKIPQEEGKEENDNDDIAKKVEEYSCAVAPVLLPMIDYLGNIEVDEGFTPEIAEEEM